MFQRLVTGAAIAGFAAGLTAAALHLLAVQPLLLLAETFETAGHAHTHATTAAHDHAAPAGGLMRNALTVLFFALTYAGFGLLLAAAMALRPGPRTWRQGVIWGLAGFAAFQFAPAFGLPPAPPGLEPGALAPRQIWWFATVALTAGGLWLLAFRRDGWALGGAALIALPHLGLAPAPVIAESALPGAVVAAFVARTLAVGAVGWAVLGALTATLARD